jgi:hypothetical protein
MQIKNIAQDKLTVYWAIVSSSSWWSKIWSINVMNLQSNDKLLHFKNELSYN